MSSQPPLKMLCPPDALFVAVREKGFGFVDVQVSDAEGTHRQFLPMRRELGISSNGFDWVSGRPGTKQLALAMLAYVVGRELALVHYDAFASGFLQELPFLGWRVPATAVRNWISVALAESEGVDSTEGPINA